MLPLELFQLFDARATAVTEANLETEEDPLLTFEQVNLLACWRTGHSRSIFTPEEVAQLYAMRERIQRGNKTLMSLHNKVKRWNGPPF